MVLKYAKYIKTSSEISRSFNILHLSYSVRSASTGSFYLPY